MRQAFDEAECGMLAEFFALFGNRTRLRIFCALQEGRKTVSELADYAKVSLPNASQHLRLMRDKGILASRRAGHTIYYHLTDCALKESCHIIRSATKDAAAVRR